MPLFRFRPFSIPRPVPPYDARVAYLEGTGTQWIDTGLFAVTNRKYNIRFLPTTDYAQYYSYNCFPLVSTSILTSLGIFGIINSTNGYRVGLNSGVKTINDDGYYNTWHDVYLDTTNGNRFASLDGVVVFTSASTGGNLPSTHIVLWNNTGKSGSGSGKLAYFSVTDATTGQKIQDLIPVRKNGVGYMYDRVTGTLLGNSGTGDFVIGPDVPFDDEVEYVQRDYSISWMKDGKPAVAASTQGFNMDKYVTDGETLANMTRRLSARYCAYPVSLANRWAVTIYHNLISAIGIGQSNNSYPYGGRVGALGTFSDSNIPTSVTPDNFHVVDVIPDGVGNYTCSVDGQIITTINNSGTSAFKYFFVLTHFTTANVTQPIMRVSNVRLGSDVYLIPVKKGSQVGFYNMVDGHVFLEEQACLSAGPVV